MECDQSLNLGLVLTHFYRRIVDAFAIICDNRRTIFVAQTIPFLAWIRYVRCKTRWAHACDLHTKIWTRKLLLFACRTIIRRRSYHGASDEFCEILLFVADQSNKSGSSSVDHNIVRWYGKNRLLGQLQRRYDQRQVDNEGVYSAASLPSVAELTV